MIRWILAKAGNSVAGLVTVLLTAVLLGLSLAVMLQAAALLVVSLMAAAVLLPHPLEWYAGRCASAVRLFFARLMTGEGPGDEKLSEEREDNR